MALELKLIGELLVVRDGRALPLPASKKTRALLAYLAATGKPQLREKLCSLLWDGPDDPRAALRWSLTKLRPLVDDPDAARLVADRERVELCANGAVIDVVALRAAVPGSSVAGVARASTQALRAVAPAIRGELLEGLELPDCYRYDEWLRVERETIHRLGAAVLSSLVARLRGTPADALGHARAWVGLEPLDETAHAAVIGLLVELDRKVEAMAQYTSCARLLERELGRGPSRELERLRIGIGALVSAPAPAPVVEVIAPERPLVGRVQERAALATALDSPRKKVVLLLGDPGIGKSRLLEELATLARDRGLAVMQGRGVEAELVRPYGAWLDAIGSTTEDPFHVAADERTGSGDADRTRLFEAVVAWLAARATPAGLLVILDDLQWIDDGSAALLHYIARSPTPVRLACGARPGELADNPAALRLVRGLTREGAVHQIGLSPLDAAETAALAVAHAPNVDGARVFAESGGHPLFAVEIARALARGDTTWSSLEALLGERLELVDGVASDVVPWAAALGGAFDAELLSGITGIPLADLSRAVGELERRAIVRVVGAEWDFVHDLVRAAAYHRISEPRRRLLHLQIARSLAGLPDEAGERAIAVAHHAGLGGDSPLCARASLTAADRCFRMFAPEEAAAHAERGLAHVSKVVGDERARLRIELLRAALDADVRHTRWAAIARDLERAIVDAQAAGCHAAAARGFNQLSRFDYESNDFSAARTRSIDAIQRARNSDDPESQGRTLAFSAQCLALIGREMPQAEALAGEAAAVLGSRADVAELPFALGLIRHHQGDDGAAITLLDRATELAVQTGQHWLAGYGWAREALIELERERPREALAYCAKLQANAGKLGDGGSVPFGSVIDALARQALGEPGNHATALDAALEALRRSDAPVLLAAALTCIAETELAAGTLEAAGAHAREAVAEAMRAERDSEVARGRSLLAQIALTDGRSAGPELDDLRAIDAALLDARARRALAAIDGIDAS